MARSSSESKRSLLANARISHATAVADDNDHRISPLKPGPNPNHHTEKGKGEPPEQRAWIDLDKPPEILLSPGIHLMDRPGLVEDASTGPTFGVHPFIHLL